jgi:multidrug transporter EmrE-like cation transporter
VKAWIYLSVGIISEVAANAALKASQGVTRLVPSVVMVISYLIALALFSLSLKSIPLSVAYPVWAGIGTAATVVVGVLLWKEAIDYRHILAIGLILAGVVILNIITPPTE